MIQTSVTMLDKNIMLFNKEGFQLILSLAGKYVIAVSPSIQATDGIPFIPLAKVHDSTDIAYVEWCRIAGKMLRKTKESKYFANVRRNEHLTNGNVTTDDWAYICQHAVSAVELYEAVGKARGS